MISTSFFLSPANCEPYSKDACSLIADELGLSMTAGDYDTQGCYGYRNEENAVQLWYGECGLWYGKGGSINDMQYIPGTTTNTLKQYRPVGYDCSGKNIDI